MIIERQRFAIKELVRSEQFGIGNVEYDTGQTVLVRFDRGIESCEPHTLTPIVSPVQALDQARWQAPLAVIVRSQAEAIRSVNDTWGIFSRSRIALLPHQLWVCRRVLEQWPTRWLVADDVGLGKTIEAGLILWPLLSQKRVDRLLILCPANLVAQWEHRLRTMFDIRLTPYMPEMDTPKTDFFGTHRQVVASLQTLRQDHNGRHTRLLESEPWDLLIVDEAHHLNTGEHEKATLGYQLVQQLVEHNKVSSMVFFTGTPHRGKNYGFLSLLHLLRPEMFDPDRPFAEQIPLLSQVMIRNNKQNVTDLKGQRLFQAPRVIPETYRYSPAEAHFYDTLTEFIVTGKAYASSLDSTNGRAVMLVLVTMQKLASSSVAAIRSALEKRLNSVVSKREQVVAHAKATAQVADILRRHDQSEQLEGDAESMADEELIGRLSVVLQGQWRLMKDEERRLRELVTAARAVDEETKIAKIISVLETQFVDRQVLLFTEYKATQALIMSALMRRFGDDSVTFINGDGAVTGVVDAEGKDRVLTAKREDAANRFNGGDVRFLISTEAGGEGIDLQERCYSLIHVDLPWNPMRMHQRVGRLNRYGQTHQVEVINIRNPDTVESRIWDVLNEKIALIAQAFAGVMDEPEDLLQLVLGMTSPSFFKGLFSESPNVSPDALRQWFDHESAQFGGKDVLETVRELVGHCSSFDFQQVSPDLPRLDLPALRPFLVSALTLNNRRVQEDEHSISFNTPDAWRRRPGVRSSYSGMIFDRNDRSKGSNERILGVGHKVMDLALEQSLALEEAVTSIPDSMLQRPVALFRVTDQVTGQGGAVRSVIVGIEGNSPARALRDWEVVEHLNALSERLGRQKWAKDSAPASNISDVRNALEQARRVAHEHVAYLDLPFKMPSVDVLTVLWPVSAHETGSNPATNAETNETEKEQPRALSTDIADRLQDLIVDWQQGALDVLHERCRTAGGPGGAALLPDRVLLVGNLGPETLAVAVRGALGPGQTSSVTFRVQPRARSDAVMVPMARDGDVAERWTLVVDSGLKLEEQVALYGHVLGHLMFNRQMSRIGQLPLLDPRDGYAHADRLDELCKRHDTPNPLDHRVLEAYPRLTALLQPCP